MRDVCIGNNGSLFLATDTTVTSIASDDTGMHTNTLATMDNMEQCAVSENVKNTLFIVGTIQGVRGVYAL